MDSVGSGSLYEVDVSDLGSEDLIGVYEDAYSSAMVTIRAVGDVMSKGKNPRNLNVSIESIRGNVETMRRVHNQAGPLLKVEAHWCCNRPRSEVMRVGVQIFDWTIALSAIGFSAAGLADDSPNNTNSSLRSLATFGVVCMHVVQGWFSGKTFEQIAYEDDLLRLMKGSAPRIRYVESMIQTFEAWHKFQLHENSEIQLRAQNLSEDVQSLIEALEAVPIRPKNRNDRCRRDVLGSFLVTRMGQRMYDASKELRDYNDLVQEETRRGDSRIVLDTEEAEDSEVDIEVEALPEKACDFLKKRKKILQRTKTRIQRHGSIDQVERGSSPLRAITPTNATLSADVLEEFIQSKWCWYVDWDIPRVTKKIEDKYRIVENQATSVGNALKRHEAEVDFETSISALEEVLVPIEKLERVARYILESNKSAPSVVSFRAQQKYRTIIELAFTGGALASSIADTVLEAREEKANTTLRTISLTALILGQIAARWDTRLQGQIFKKMRSQQTLRGILAHKYSKTTRSLIRYWTSCQKALESGRDSDVERALAVRVPRPMMDTCKAVAENFIQKRREREQTCGVSSGALELSASADPTIPVSRAVAHHQARERAPRSTPFETRVSELAEKAQREAKKRLSVAQLDSRDHETRHAVVPSEFPEWDDIDSEEDETRAEGDWKVRLRQIRKLEIQRRSDMFSSAETHFTTRDELESPFVTNNDNEERSTVASRVTFLTNQDSLV